jgi:hypothetical protein
MGKTASCSRKRYCLSDSRRSLTEYEEQVLYFQWIETKPFISPFVFHIPNERKTTWAAGKRLKASGVRAGIPDIFVAIPRGIHNGLFIEMKSLKGRLSEAQKEYLERLNKQGYIAQACYGFEAAKALTESYLKS